LPFSRVNATKTVLEEVSLFLVLITSVVFVDVDDASGEVANSVVFFESTSGGDVNPSVVFKNRSNATLIIIGMLVVMVRSGKIRLL